MRNVLLLTGAAALSVGAISAQALAADPMPMVVAPTTVATYVEQAAPRTWTGGYVGGHAGLARGAMSDGLECWDDEFDEWAPAYFFVEDVGDDLDVDGDCDWNATPPGTLDPFANWDDVIYYGDEEFPPPLAGYLIGGQIGYLRQLGAGPNGFVIGGEVGYSLANIGASWNSSFVPFVAWNDEFEITGIGTATMRAGFAFGPALIYGEVGLALVNANFTNSFGFSDTDVATGLVWGGGVEGRIAENISVFFEYNRLNVTHTFLGTGANAFVPGEQLPTMVGISSTLNIFKVGFNVHFGG